MPQHFFSPSHFNGLIFFLAGSVCNQRIATSIRSGEQQNCHQNKLANNERETPSKHLKSHLKEVIASHCGKKAFNEF